MLSFEMIVKFPWSAWRAAQHLAQRWLAGRWLTALLLGLIVGGVAALLQIGWLFADAAGNPLAAFDEALQDRITRAVTQGAQTDRAALTDGRDPRDFITIVAIDERTIAELGAYNGGYPRRDYAQVVDNLLAEPPRVIAFDMGFFEPTPDDALLAAAFERARSLPVPSSIVLGSVGLVESGQAAAIGPDGERTFPDALKPVPSLADGHGLGMANLLVDARGTIRSVPLVMRVDGMEQPTLGLAAVTRYLRRSSALETRTDSTARLAGRTIPLEDGAALRIMYQGPPSEPYRQDSTFRVVSFVDVLKGRVNPSTWRDGLVFIGVLGATGLADDYWTPTSDGGHKMAGVEIHANAAATLFSAQFLHEAPLPVQVALIIGLATLVALLTATMGGVPAALAASLILGTYTGVNIWTLAHYGWLAPFTAPVAACLLSFSITAAQRVTVEQRQARQLRTEARNGSVRDAVTGLANRTRLENYLVAFLAADIQPAAGCALLRIDLERFKDIHDSLGRGIGDSFLRQIAQRLRATVPTSAVIARMDGGEFAVALPGEASDGATRLAHELLQVLTTPVELGGREVVCGVSIGIVNYPLDADDADTLLRHAELAVSAARQTDAGWAVYSSEHDRQAAERLALIGRFGTALEEHEFVLYVQPKVECQSGGLAGVEVLVRWQHPELGLIGPDRFIPLAEQTGAIRPLTRWVLSESMRQYRHWADDGLDVPIAVNLSALDVQDLELPKFVAELLACWELPADRFTLEITEGALLTAPDQALQVLNELGALGVHMALDDFGSGYSSLGYLKRFPVGELKLDRSLVTDIVTEPRDQAIVRLAIELGHSLGMVMLAEGVEDQATLDLLTSYGCDLVQGYLLSRPMPALDLPTWILNPDTFSAAHALGVARHKRW